jgi:hypothetical protein
MIEWNKNRTTHPGRQNDGGPVNGFRGIPTDTIVFANTKVLQKPIVFVSEIIKVIVGMMVDTLSHGIPLEIRKNFMEQHDFYIDLINF